MNKIPNLNLFQNNSFEMNSEFLEKMDVADQATRVTLANFMINNKTDLHKKINQLGLDVVNLKLEKKIKEIKSDTTGIIGFFKYLFRPTVKAEKQLQLEQMIILQEFIKNIKKVKNIQENEILPSKEFENQIEEEEPILTPSKLAAQIETKISPFNEGIESIAFSGLETILIEEEKPSILPSPLPPAPMIGAPPPPPAPPMPGAPPVIVKKKFDQEPDAPSIILPGKTGAKKLESLSIKELKKEIEKIEKFVGKLSEVLQPIEEIVTEAAELEEKIKEKTQEQNQLKSEIADLEKKKAILEQPQEICFFKFKVKAGEELDFPLYSDEKFEEINCELKKLGAKSLSHAHRKSDYKDKIVEDLNNAQKKKNFLDTIIKNDKEKQETIQKEKNNGILFCEYEENLKKKREILGEWERALKKRREQLTKRLKPPEKSNLKDKKMLPAEKKSLVLSISEAITHNDYLAERSDLLALKALEENQNAQIKLRGEEFHRELSS